MVVRQTVVGNQVRDSGISPEARHLPDVSGRSKVLCVLIALRTSYRSGSGFTLVPLTLHLATFLML